MQKRTCRRGGKQGGRRVKYRKTRGRSRKARRGGDYEYDSDNQFHLTQAQWDTMNGSNGQYQYTW